MRQTIIVATAAFLLIVPAAHQAAAQGQTPAAARQTLVLQANMATSDVDYGESLWQVARDAWNAVYGWFGGAANRVTPPTPASLMADIENKDSRRFVNLLLECGYKLKEIQAGIGVIPAASLKFGLVRELTEGDKLYLDQKLERWIEDDGSPASIIKRAIIYTILDINDKGQYAVEELKVEMLPLPKATFSLGPVEGGLSQEGEILLRAIKGEPGRTRPQPAGPLTN